MQHEYARRVLGSSASIASNANASPVVTAVEWGFASLDKVALNALVWHCILARRDGCDDQFEAQGGTLGSLLDLFAAADRKPIDPFASGTPEPTTRQNSISNTLSRGKLTLIVYRPFHNTDPPKLIDLWNAADLGRGAAIGFSCDAFDSLVLAEPYFDRRGLIVACDGDDVIGYVHAGFGANDAGSALDYTAGVICIVMVHPRYRRRGIGRELIVRAENYLTSRGAVELFAGEAPPRCPFYLGLYGGAESAGFLESDINAAPFFSKLGYVPASRRLVFRRDITQKSETFDPRFPALRRKVQLEIRDHPPNASWWWMTRQGRLDSLCFVIVPLAGEETLAIVTCWGMDFHSMTWGQRTVGLTDVFVPVAHRRQAFAKVLLLEVIRRMRDELVTHAEIVAPESHPAAGEMCRKLGFQQVDTGVVYQRSVKA